MLPHDEALNALVFSPGGLLECLPEGAIHMVSGTHGVEIIRKLTAAHAEAGQVLVAGHVLGRPDLAAEGELTLVPGGPPEALQRLMPIFDVLGKRTFITGDEPQSSTAVKIANNFVLGSVIEIIGESMSLVRKFGVEPALFQQVMTEGLFGAPAFHVYGQIIVDEALRQGRGIRGDRASRTRTWRWPQAKPWTCPCPAPMSGGTGCWGPGPTVTATSTGR